MMNPIVFRATFIALISAAATAVACSGTEGSEDPVESTSSALEPAATTPAADGGDGGLECTGPLPQICEDCPDHTRACAHWGVVDGKCEVEMCASSTRPTPECQGLGTLPAVCLVCADGRNACAHWAIVDGGCEVEICGDSSPAPVPVEAPVAVDGL